MALRFNTLVDYYSNFRNKDPKILKAFLVALNFEKKVYKNVSEYFLGYLFSKSRKALQVRFCKTGRASLEPHQFTLSAKY